MDVRDLPTDSYGLWLLFVLPPTAVVGALTDALIGATAAGVVLASFAYFSFNYPF